MLDLALCVRVKPSPESSQFMMLWVFVLIWYRSIVARLFYRSVLNAGSGNKEVGHSGVRKRQSKAILGLLSRL